MINFNNIIVSEDATILQTMKVINDTISKLCIVVDSRNVLIGTVTDGDIRRGLLNGHELQNKVTLIMNKSPTVAMEGTSKAEIQKILEQKKIFSLPVVNKDHIVVGVEYSSETLKMMEKPNHVIIMAGGLGSRLGDLTSNCPKPMLKVGHKPILETIIENFRDHGFKHFYISVNYMSEAIEEYFHDGKKWGVEITYLRENSKLGTAGSLSLYEAANNMPVIVMNGDLLTNINMTKLLDLHETNNNDATMGVRQYAHQVPYGVIVTENEKIVRVEEKPIYSYFVSGGVYVLNPAVLKYIPQDTFYDMPTFFQDLINKKYTVGFYPIQEYWLDIGRKDDFDRAHNDFQDIVLVNKFRE